MRLLFLLLFLPLNGDKDPHSKLTPEERKFAINYLVRTRARLLKDVNGLSKDQLYFRPDDTSWSVAQCVEHITLSEDLIKQWIPTIAYIKSTQDDLKDHFIDHPQWGAVDLYEAFVMLSAHCERHTEQLEEVMANPKFPKH